MPDQDQLSAPTVKRVTGVLYRASNDFRTLAGLVARLASRHPMPLDVVADEIKGITNGALSGLDRVVQHPPDDHADDGTAPPVSEGGDR